MYAINCPAPWRLAAVANVNRSMDSSHSSSPPGFQPNPQPTDSELARNISNLQIAPNQNLNPAPPTQQMNPYYQQPPQMPPQFQPPYPPFSQMAPCLPLQFPPPYQWPAMAPSYYWPQGYPQSIPQMQPYQSQQVGPYQAPQTQTNFQSTPQTQGSAMPQSPLADQQPLGCSTVTAAPAATNAPVPGNYTHAQIAVYLNKMEERLNEWDGNVQKMRKPSDENAELIAQHFPGDMGRFNQLLDRYKQMARRFTDNAAARAREDEEPQRHRDQDSIRSIGVGRGLADSRFASNSASQNQVRPPTFGDGPAPTVLDQSAYASPQSQYGTQQSQYGTQQPQTSQQYPPAPAHQIPYQQSTPLQPAPLQPQPQQPPQQPPQQTSQQYPLSQDQPTQHQQTPFQQTSYQQPAPLQQSQLPQPSSLQPQHQQLQQQIDQQYPQAQAQPTPNQPPAPLQAASPQPQHQQPRRQQPTPLQALNGTVVQQRQALRDGILTVDQLEAHRRSGKYATQRSSSLRNPRPKLPFPKYIFQKELSQCPLYPQRKDKQGIDDMVARPRMLHLDDDEDQGIPGGCRNNHNLSQEVLDWLVANGRLSITEATNIVNSYIANRTIDGKVDLHVPVTRQRSTAGLAQCSHASGPGLVPAPVPKVPAWGNTALPHHQPQTIPTHPTPAQATQLQQQQQQERQRQHKQRHQQHVPPQVGPALAAPDIQAHLQTPPYQSQLAFQSGPLSTQGPTPFAANNAWENYGAVAKDSDEQLVARNQAPRVEDLANPPPPVEISETLTSPASNQPAQPVQTPQAGSSLPSSSTSASPPPTRPQAPAQSPPPQQSPTPTAATVQILRLVNVPQSTQSRAGLGSRPNASLASSASQASPRPSIEVEGDEKPVHILMEEAWTRGI
ncbi:hypothetical protein K491DRAFT_678681 [Lophiostoma macrostomum CBS 122681]|uniref:Uncharacterized protein n=1 Tax=Lophiostoma macrostomum CBS 122681 TaxID=1314788 RepID=A0A6A6T8J0_9PLEO|nr:hypothetical protein K491DRAFT_678681 [Lophiostoma macrostomum CBS 122681]